MKNKQRIISIAMAMLITLAGAGSLYALRAPHNKAANNISCSSCHLTGGKIRGLKPVCIEQCHNVNSSSKAKRKPLDLNRGSNIFGTFTLQSPALQLSHAWSTQPNYSTAGKNNRKAGTSKNISLNQVSLQLVSGTSTIICSKCHYAMGYTDSQIAASGGTINKPFLRVSTKGNFICFQCHDERRVNNVRDPLAAGKAYSHPVEVNYSSAHASKPASFELSPTNIYATAAAVLPLYTTYDNVKGAVVCSTCHGPMHSADSNPYTFDNMSLFSMGQYSTGDGRLLRRYGKAKDVNNTLCKACHKVTAHKGFSCYRCHTPHKRQGDANRYLILENISTPNNGIRPIYFEYTTGMARRYGAEFTANGKTYFGGYSQAKSRLDKTRPTSSAICQACHTTTKYQRNYSATGTVTRIGGAPSAHPSVYDPGTGKYRACIGCHVHTDAFNPTGGGACSSCHDAPPFDTYSSGLSATVIGRHNKHVNDVNGSNPGVSYSWGDGALNDARLPNAYGFSCGRCHNPWSPYTGLRHKPATLNQGVYTAEVGFDIRADQALPKNPNATYTRGARGSRNDPGSNAGDGINWSVPGTGGGTCNNLYCHGQWYGGYTGNNPSFTGTQVCGKCHGAKPNDPPGKVSATGVNYGAHPRHVGNANSQQYGSASPMNFRCNACHYTTVQASMTSINDRSKHVDGRANVLFDTTQYGNAASTYNGFNEYTGRKPAMFTRPAYKTCGLIYCHSDGSRTQGNYSVPFNAEQGSGTTKFPNWSSSSSGNFTTTRTINSKTFKRRCSRCHGNSAYAGITAAMPGYVTRAGKGNSHDTHIKNGFLCRVCHSETVNADNKSIASTNKHVNKTYDIKILRSYSGIYDPGTQTCSMVSCHGRKTTPIWGNTAVCQNCHLSNTGDVDKRIKVSNTFQSFSEAAAKIYSTQWADTGHGRNAGSYGSGNQPAAKVCTDCHEAAIKHGTGSNPFRLLTAPDRPNMVCERCHGVGASEPGVNKTGIQTHASSVVQTGRHNFAIKCIDCHDPHGDNNTRFMVHSTVARPLITGTRAESSNPYGQRQANVTSSNVDFNQNLYSSDYARKYKAAKICQVCHTRTKNPTTGTEGRFRWYSAGDKDHGSNKCVNCHTHASGFKGAGCTGCHGFPPTGTFNLISMASGSMGKRASKSVTAGAHGRHTTVFGGNATTCSKCHYSGMWGSGSESGDIELEFRAFTDYSGASQKYNGQSVVGSGYYGYSGIGAGPADNSYRCNVKCHGAKGAWLTKSFGNVTAPRWNDTTRNSVFCGSCHGAKKAKGVGTWPTTNAHARHAGTNTDSTNRQYDFMCKLCHNKTVLGTATTLSYSNAHVDGRATFEFYTGSGGDSKGRVWSQSIYTGGDTKVNSGFGRCENLYCHSKGTKMAKPYNNTTALRNYTAKWTAANVPAGNAKCSYCHGNRTYKGITAAMPNYTSILSGGPKANSHRKHVIENGFMCNVCHSKTINSVNNSIIFTNGTSRHVNKVYDIAILSAYSGTYNGTTCSNVKCHAKKTTPAWGNKIICQNCHMTGSGVSTAEDDFTWGSFSGVAAKIYSTEWTKRGHGKSRSSGEYAFSNNSGAGRTCTNCHKPEVKHNASNNYFRLYTSNPDRLCLNCHGAAGERGSWGMTISNVTGIQSHTWNNISTAGYNGGKIKAASRGGWNFGEHDSADKKKVKCVDCHDPHGDRNNYMLHSFINMSGSDRVGRPNPKTATAQMQFSTVGGPQMNWSSYVKNTYDGICQRCHSDMMSGTTSIMDNFNKAKYSNHNRTKRCTDCHKHKQGFKPSGCDGCHGYPPPNGPTSPNNWAELEGTPSTVGLHTPHAKNPRNRPGITAENDVTGAAGFKCNRCHANTNDGSDPTMGSSNNKNAIMTQLESVYGNWTAGALQGYQSVTDDTCSNIKCHTPRYYERTWKKPTGCDDCHGYRNKTNLAFKVQTTNAHKIHVSYTTAGYDKKKYGLACSNCHYNWQGLNNYSTHYSSYVNITAMGPVNTKGGQFYGRGRVFKGFSTGAELTNAGTTCSKVYCHGNFVNGTTQNPPIWKKGAMSTTCGSCHKAKTAKVSGWADGAIMPETHPKHVVTAEYNFACARCHVRTVTNNTTVQFSYSSHVNGRKDIYFNTATTVDAGRKFTVINTAATFGGGNRACKNVYCHSRGTDRIAPYNTRTSFANWTARWGDSRGGYKQANGLKAKCNYCHGNRRYSGMTSAMPNYSGNYYGTPAGVTAKANSHKKHVVDNGFVCSTCHNSIANSNTSISDRTRHVNGFYNISITPLWRGATGQKVYSMVYDGSGGTCMNNKCHGTSTPKWGDPQTAACKLCHFSGTADKDNYARNDGVKAEIYSSEWRRKGHGQFAAFTSRNLNRCERCHKPAVGHNTASNPFRLKTSVPDKLCAGCHGSATERGATWNYEATNVDYKTHSKANAGKDAAWNTHSSVTGKGPKCIDCHDPHGDKNRKMIHSYLNHSGSDRFGRPAGRPWNDGAINYTTAAMMTFTSWNYGVQLGWSTFSNGVLAQSLCRRCHTPVSQDTGMGNDPASSPGNMTKANYAGTHQSHQKCTNCHNHKAGFKGGGESTGSMSCDGCHGSGGNPDLSPMTNGQTRSYHHVLQNTSAVGNNKYPITNNLTTVGDSRRRCLMCHVDHNVFRPDMNGNDPRGRAANLRANIFTKPTSNVDSTRNNSDWSGTDPYGGICLSCHTRAQRKNAAKQFNDGSKFTLRILTSQFRNSPHNYTAIGVINTDGSKFKANCLKCHNDTTPKVKFKSNSGFSAHDSKLRRLNSQLGLTIFDGPIGAYLNTTRIRAANNPSWTNNQWAGRVVTIKPTTAGTGREQTRIILTNTTSGLTVDKGWKGTPTTSDYLTIGDPPEEDYCFNCHSPYSNPNYSQSKDYYGMVTFVNKKALKMEMVFKGEANFATGGTNGAAPTLIDTAADTIWGTDVWKDFVVKIIGGIGAGQTGIVTSNTANTLTMTAVGVSWKKAPTTASEYALGNPYKHRIENFGGVHQSDEMVRAPGGVTTYGWFTTLGQGYKPHVGCTDCHNPHAQRKPGVDRGVTEKTLSTSTSLHFTSKNWNTNEFRGLLAVAIDRSNVGEERMIVENNATRLRVGVPFSAKMTGVYFTIYPKGRAFVAISTATGAGNMLSGPNNGQWGIKVVSWKKPTPSTVGTSSFDNISAPVMSKMTTLTSGKDRIYNLCFKCHSRYAWGTSGKPFNIQNAFTTEGSTKKFREGQSADIASRFNPNNLAHHAVIRPGKNQPIVPNYGFTSISSYYNPNWPKYSTGTDALTIDTSGNAALGGTAKLPITVIPGWYVYVGSDTANGRTDGKAQAGAASSGWFQITQITSNTAFKVTPAPGSAVNNQNWAISAGFGNNFVPPIGPWSVIACTDCHDTSSASDPAGPHGSGFRWILRGLEPQAFPWFNGTNVITVKYSNIGWAAAEAARAICLNCHRADVYGFGGNEPEATLTSGGTGTLPVTTDDPGNWSNFAWRGHFSRQPHSPDIGGAETRAYDAAHNATNVFGINCMHCHAGSEIGQIHGTNMGRSRDMTGADAGAGNSWRGKRFLTGGTWVGVRRSSVATAGFCYAESSVTPDAIASCNDNINSAMRTAATYDFEAGSDY